MSSEAISSIQIGGISTGELPADVAIRVQNLSKVYQIYSKPHDRLKQSLYPRLQRSLGWSAKQYHREFWALNDVSFEVKRGEAMGIIGRNGSGKSTLLQLICGTLAPTSGSIQVNGRVAALLELGAGFNPEFTGRENVYMSASILGLATAEIDAVYDDIIAFAGIDESFIEQPVKIYSSGMYVRLAFAVIAHVDADIMIIDEALAVGDAVFVQKCMRFLRSFRERGTLLFVSHDTGSVINFCKSALWLDQGTSRMQATAQDVCNSYIEYCAQATYGDAVKIRSIQANRGDRSAAIAPETDPDVKISLFDNIAHSDGWKSDCAAINSVNLTDMSGVSVTVVTGGEMVRLTIVAETFRPLESPIIGFFVKDRLGQALFGENTFTRTESPPPTREGDALEAQFVFRLPMLPDGEYSMTVAIADGSPRENVQHHWLHDAVLIRVASTKLRYGLVGIPFESVDMRILKPEEAA